MDADGWRSARSLSARVREDYPRFDFFQLVRLLRRERAGARAQAPLERAVRFRADLSAAFPGNEVTRVVDAGTHRPVTLDTPNYILAGHLGPLPEPFTEWLRERKREDDRVMADFLDLFNHRLSALRCLIKMENHPGLAGERPERIPLAGHLAALMGLGAPGLAAQLRLPGRALLGIAGLLADCRRSAALITNVLSAWVGASVALRQLIGAWRDLDPRDRTRLGVARHALGTQTVLGTRMWDQQARIELRIGPLPYARFRQLLPGERAHRRFVALVRYLTDRRCDCEVRLVLAAEAQPAPRLARSGPRLGYTSWLAGRRAAREEDRRRTASFLVPAFPEAHGA
jgi:type VI secretion system protein ImpH